MRTLAALIVGAAVGVLAQTTTGPTFDVVSIKRHAREPGPFGFTSTLIQRQDGGLTMTNVPAAILISRAYPSLSRVDVPGLPQWAMSERYDVSATSTLSRATVDDRVAMMRAMLADRFKLVVHIEKREQPVYDLILANSDGQLGPGLTSSAHDCAAKLEEQRDSVEWGVLLGPPPDFDPKAPPPPCRFGLFAIFPDRLEGETTMPMLALRLREPAGRLVVDKTGLVGSYRVKLTYYRWMLGGARLTAPNVVSGSNAVPVVFTAVREQLGLRFESSKAERDTLIIDRLERPTEN